MAVVNLGEPNKTSGALYQSVTTLAVIFLGGTPKKRANPKSAIKCKIKNNLFNNKVKGYKASSVLAYFYASFVCN